MSDVTRYDFRRDHFADCHCDMVVVPDGGGYVSHDDYAALAARLRAAEAARDAAREWFQRAEEQRAKLEAENARLREVIDNAAIPWLALEPGIEWEGDLAAAMSAACGEIVRLRSANARLRDAEARLVRAENLLSTFRDHAFIPELLERDVEEIDAFLAARAPEARDA